VAPAAILLEQLAAARRAGVTFEEAWPDALATALQSADRSERAHWREALSGTVDAWIDAWLRRPPQSGAERALLLLADGSDREPMPDRECVRCGREIPEDRGRHGAPAKYCSAKCRHAACEERARLTAA
jgi:hypothetical protein